ncbi:MAG: butyrate kinase [Candidatus Cloacimonadota bacterium]|jgi:butyrate kinase|nr:butyrate kinase [Candidatus Cloacimonadota bacterium]
MGKKLKILVINPGNMSTHIALFENDNLIREEKVEHSKEELSRFSYRAVDQIDFRSNVINVVLNKWNITDLSAVIGRGGLFKPLESGTYAVNDKMVEDIEKGNMSGEHMSNIGALLAMAVANKFGVPSYIADPVSVDEFEPLARVSGIPQIPRDALQHTLNIKSVIRRYSSETAKKLEELNLIVAHLGSGISICPIKKGRIVDANNAIQEGPFSPQRSGGLPVNHLIDLCFSGKYTQPEIKKLVTGKGGLTAYLGTGNLKEIVASIEKENDTISKFYLEAMAYQIAKEIGAMATVIKGDVEAIIITGNAAYVKLLVDWIKERVKFIAPVFVFAGADEMRALAENTLRVLTGKESAKIY